MGGSSVAARNLGVPVSGQDPALRADRVLRVDPATIEPDLLLGRHPAQHSIGSTPSATAVIRRLPPDRRVRLVAGRRSGRSRSDGPPGHVFADINADWYKIAIGTLLLVAVVLNNWIRRRFAGLWRMGPMEATTPAPVADPNASVAAAGQPPLLEAREVSKYFGAVVAIEGVSR